MAVEALRFSEEPQLREPALIMAFAGWNDAAEAATAAVRYLVRTWSATKFADVDPEEFYDFTQVRPRVRLTSDLQRRVRWPSNNIYYHADPALSRDYLLMAGIEPQLRWRGFCGAIMDLIRRLNVKQVLLLGGLVADVPHTRPIRVTGSSTDSELSHRLETLNMLRQSRYEGPTGIVGVLSDTLRVENVPCSSLWATVPHYISSVNPRATLALLTRLQVLFDILVPLASLEREAQEFDQQVAKAVERDPDVASYVRRLEESALEEDEAPSERPELPAGDAIVRELEEFLRRSRGEPPGPAS
jgi:proteasome assembly chaperone (PAC2) family protein